MRMQTWNLAPRMLVEWKYKIEDTFQRRPPHTLPRCAPPSSGRGTYPQSAVKVSAPAQKVGYFFFSFFTSRPKRHLKIIIRFPSHICLLEKNGDLLLHHWQFHHQIPKCETLKSRQLSWAKVWLARWHFSHTLVLNERPTSTLTKISIFFHGIQSWYLNLEVPSLMRISTKWLSLCCLCFVLFCFCWVLQASDMLSLNSDDKNHQLPGHSR